MAKLVSIETAVQRPQVQTFHWVGNVRRQILNFRA